MKHRYLALAFITLSLPMLPQQGYAQGARTNPSFTAHPAQTAQPVRTAPTSGSGSFAPTPKGPSKYSCTAGVGCNCWGNSDCNALVQSGKCHGNPLTCDQANPNSCHCK